MALLNLAPSPSIQSPLCSGTVYGSFDSSVGTETATDSPPAVGHTQPGPPVPNSVAVTMPLCARLPPGSPAVCRICGDGSAEGKLVQPCGCRGSVSSAHLDCLEMWINSRTASSRVDDALRCEICLEPYAVFVFPIFLFVSAA